MSETAIELGQVPETSGMPGMGLRLHYLCLQAAQEGQASHAHVYEIVEGLRRRGWQVEIFEPQLKGAARGIAGKLLEFARVQWRLFRRKPRPDILYVRAHPLALPAALWAYWRGIPSVMEVNSTYEDVFSIYPWTRFLRRLVYAAGDWSIRFGDSLITVTQELSEWLCDRFAKKPVFVVPNGANTNLFHPDAAPCIEDGHAYIVFVGALSPWQGIDLLLAAVEEPEWPRNVRLVIAGDGPERVRVEAAAKINPCVQYLGKQPYRKIPGLLTGALAAVSVGTSLRRHFSPLKLYEALACGTPVIVSDQPGQAGLVRSLDCGLLVPSGDPNAIARAAATLAGDRAASRKMGARGAAVVRAEHSWQHRADQTGSILLATLEGTRA